MSIIEFFLGKNKRIVLACVINIVICILGIFALSKLDTRLLPRAENYIITVEASMSDTSPSQLENQVTTLMEKTLGGIPDLDEMESHITTGRSLTFLRFRGNQSWTENFSNVQAAIAKISSILPRPEVMKLDIKKADPNTSPLLYIFFTNKNIAPDIMYDYISRDLENIIKSHPGVGHVNVWGGSNYGAEIKLDSNKMRALNIRPSDVYSALSEQNKRGEVGRVVSKDSYVIVMFDNSVKNEEDLRNISLRVKNKNIEYPVRIGDIAKVTFGPANADNISKFNGERVVGVSIVPQSGSSPVEVSRSIKAKINDWKSIMPPGTDINIIFNDADYIESSIHQVYRAIFESVILVLIIIFLFLGSWRAAVVPLIAIPISLIGVFFILWIFGGSINNLTMLGLVLAAGLVVDDAILVIENVHRYIEKKMHPEEATLKGGNEIQFSVIAMTLTLAIVYSPLALISGTIGSIFKEFAVALSAAVIISGVTALTISPIMCATLLEVNHTENKLTLTINSILKYLMKKYEYALHFCLKNKKYTVLGALILIISTAIMYSRTKFEQFPREDSGRIRSSITISPGYDITYALRQTDAIYNKIKQEFPEIEKTFIDTKSGVSTTSHELTSKKNRDDVFKVVERLHNTMDIYLTGTGIRHMNISSENISDITSSSASDELKIKVFSRSEKGNKNLDDEANRIGEFLRTKFPMIFNQILYNRNPPGKLKCYRVDNNKAAAFGVNTSDLIYDTRLSFQDSLSITKMYKDGQPYDIRILSDNRSQSQLDTMYARGIKDNEYINIPIKAISEVEDLETESSIDRIDGRRCTIIYAKLKNNISPIDAYYRVKDHIEKFINSNEYLFSPLGVVKEVLEEQSNILQMFMLAILFIYLVMAAQFNSFIDPIVVMFSVPMALFGAVFAIWITSMFGGPLTINVYTQIGFLTLIGLIVRHAIMLVDFAKSSGEKDADKAMIQGCLIRFRPVLMTTLAIVIGTIPLVISGGTGYESRQQIGYCIIFGMIFGTLFTLLVVPAVYSLVNDVKVYFRRS